MAIDLVTLAKLFRYAKRIIKDGEGETSTEIAPGTKVYKLVEGLTKYLPEEHQRFRG